MAMSEPHHDAIVDLLRRIEANQRQGLDAQREQIAFARVQVERTERMASESLAVQKAAVERAKRAGAIALPLVVVLLALLAYLLIRYRVL
jgi:hypothetical protein